MQTLTIHPTGWRFETAPLPAELFYRAGVPLLMALHLGWHHPGATSLGQRTVELGYFSGLALMSWCSLILCTHALFHLFRRVRPAPWMLWLGGALLSLVVLSYPKMVYVQLSNVFLASPYHGSDGPFLSWSRITQALSNAPPGIIAWLAVNAFYDRVLNLPRFRYPAPAVASPVRPVFALPAPAPQTPDFLTNLPAIGTDQILALEACDHYIRVHTATSRPLILYRFGDAVEQMAGVPGLQVHRSYWVASRAIQTLQRHKHAHQLLLSHGVQVPVSRTYLSAVKAESERLGFNPDANSD
jgi:hypothetical protein